MQLATAIRRNRATHKRIVCATVVAESSAQVTPSGSLDSPDAGYAFWQRVVATAHDHDSEKENLIAVMLNTRLRPICWNIVSIGSVNESIAMPREIFRPAIAANAFAILLMHNHPSGEPNPSDADTRLTTRILDSGKMLAIKLIDHLVIGKPSPGRMPYFSFREAGYIG